MDFQPMQPPKSYTSLASVMVAPLETDVNVIGVVVDYMPPAPTRGTDWNCSMFLQDSSLLGSHHNQTGLRVRIFRPPHSMPQRLELGDIVVIRGSRWRCIQGNNCLVDPYKNADYLFFSSTSIPDDAFKAPHVSEESRVIMHDTLPGKVVTKPGPEEQDYIIKLREWAKKHAGWLPQPDQQGAPAPVQQPPPRPMANTSTTLHRLPPQSNFTGVPTGPRISLQGTTRKFALLKNIIEGKFHDLAGEVIKIYDSGQVVDMYISDYTFNPSLFDYKENGGSNGGREGDPYGYADSVKSKRKWQGPWGKHTICVALFEPHASYVRREVKEGEFVKVHNARCYVKDNAPLQAKLHEDRRHPDQIDVAKLSYTHELYKMVNTLKGEYWEARNGKGKNAGSKKEKKKKKKKLRREQEAKEKAAAEAAVSAAGEEQDDPEENMLFVEDTRDKLNSKVFAAHPDRPTIPLTKILETPFRTYRDRQGQEQALPFINQKCRAKVRVVDFFPPDLEDFAQCLDEPDYNDITFSNNDSTISLDDASTPRERWEWCFYLLVEDARPIPGQEPVRIPLLVHGADAVHLLNLEATDLRHNLQVKTQLETKLWTLWGNLEELKSNGEWTEMVKTANHPFECCVDEYGVWDGDEDTGEWKRVHRIKQTVIRD